MNTQENNKLIDNFMGNNIIHLNIPFEYEIGEELPTSNEICSEENAEDEVRLEIAEGIVNSFDVYIKRPEYHNSWDLLMDVVEKIESLGNDVAITSNYIQITFNEGESFINIELKGSIMLDATYEAVVKFIKWFNEQK